MKRFFICMSILLFSFSIFSKPEMKFMNTTIDFGEVESGKIVNVKFEFENKGDSLLLIKNIRTTCGCTVTRLAKREYKPGEKGVIPVKFYTSGLRGNVIKTITVSTNDPENVYHSLKLKGIVKLKDFAQAEMDPKVIDFKKVFLGELYDEKIYIRNSGSTNLLIIEITHSPEVYLDFGQKVILPGEEIEVPVYFRPMEIGKFSTFLKVRTNSHKNYYKIVKVQAEVDIRIEEEEETEE